MGWFAPGRGSYSGGVSFGSTESQGYDTHTIRGIVAGGSPFLISGSCVITGSVSESIILDLQRGQNTGAHLRLTYTSGSVYTDFKIDSSHDLTITPSSTGQIKLQPTTDSTDFFQVLDADGGTPVLNVDSTNERVGIGTASPAAMLDVAGHIFPSADDSYDLGSSSKRFRNVYTGDLHLKNDKGDWTIVEDRDYLCLVNNLTGKRYKFVLEELPEEEQ